MAKTRDEAKAIHPSNRALGIDVRGVWRCSMCGITGIAGRTGLTLHEEEHLLTIGDL